MKSILKRTIVVVLLIVILFFIFDYVNNYKIHKYNSEIVEFSSGKTHFCKISENENLKVADCMFDTNLGIVPGKVVLLNKTLYLYNEEHNQAIIFKEIEPIFGFVFEEFVNLTNNVSNITYMGNCEEPNFEFPENTEFINKKDMVFMIN